MTQPVKKCEICGEPLFTSIKYCVLCKKALCAQHRYTLNFKIYCAEHIEEAEAKSKGDEYDGRQNAHYNI